MASSRSECPKCKSARNVRLLSEGQTALRYWCSECRTPFEIRKIARKPKK